MEAVMFHRFWSWLTRPTATEMDRLLVRRRLEDVLQELEQDASDEAQAQVEPRGEQEAPHWAPPSVCLRAVFRDPKHPPRDGSTTSSSLWSRGL